ncbi:hypothetical protein [Niallia sp. RD1]|uniref:hypothetical protein n=1 Tax=Niallia sp. RD1 TaxID=2962858 RepID=UPI0020C1B475|nr:hypothetical protein [Niallia sp. RD1]UTI40686.1 hypothetical protein NKG37_17495 [Niallia sp. RD1]
MGISAKNSIYQPNAKGNQPKIQYISQTQEEISQKFDISAKLKKKSAKNSIYQPNSRRNQPNLQYISQTKQS